MYTAERLRPLSEVKKLSRGATEKRMGLLRRYISSVENCHTVPSIETREKIARASQMPVCQLYESKEILCRSG